MSQNDFYYEFGATPSEIGLAHGDALGPVSWSTECLLPCRRGNLLDDACIGRHLHSADCSRWPPDERLPQMPEWTEKPWLRSSPQINDW